MKNLTTRIESPRIAARRTGWPEKRLRKLIAEGRIRYLKIGSNFYLPDGAIEEFINSNSVPPCPNAIQ